MKYQFGRNSKKISSRDVKSHMSFENVAKAAKVFAGVKLTSVMLKSGFGSSTAATVGTIGTAAVITTAAIVGPEYFTTNPEPQENTIELIEIPEDTITVELDFPPIIVNVDSDEPKSKDEVISEIEDETTIEEDEQAIENKDVLVRAHPLPDLETFMSIINNDIEYPKIGIKDSVEGFVRVFFKVDKQGIAQDFKINRSLGEAFDNEAIRVLKSHQDWEPASFNGQAVDSYFTIKIQFKYQSLDPSNPTKGN